MVKEDMYWNSGGGDDMYIKVYYNLYLSSNRDDAQNWSKCSVPTSISYTSFMTFENSLFPDFVQNYCKGFPFHTKHLLTGLEGNIRFVRPEN